MHKDITEVFCFIDDFAKIYEQDQQKKLLPSNKQRCREGAMGLGEILTIMIMFHTCLCQEF